MNRITIVTEPSIQPDPPKLTPKQKVRAWLELARISNLPTVWTNVLVGVAIATVGFSGSIQYSSPSDAPFGLAMNPWRMLGVSVVPIMAISMFYIAGMILNDLLDLPIDKVERPQRPLPSGRISVKTAQNVVRVLFAVGFFSISLWSIREDADIRSSMWGPLWASALMASIIGYNYWHKRHPASIVFMGVSRSLVYVTAAYTLYWPMDITHPVWLMPVVLGLYTIGITVIARGETNDRIDGRKWLAPFMLLAVIAMFSFVRPPWFNWTKDVNELIWIGIAALALSIWLAPTIRYVFAKPPKTVKAILTWLSGMCLVDAYFLTLLGQPILAAIAGGCFLLTAWGHRHILGT